MHFCVREMRKIECLSPAVCRSGLIATQPSAERSMAARTERSSHQPAAESSELGLEGFQLAASFVLAHAASLVTYNIAVALGAG